MELCELLHDQAMPIMLHSHRFQGQLHYIGEWLGVPPSEILVLAFLGTLMSTGFLYSSELHLCLQSKGFLVSCLVQAENQS